MNLRKAATIISKLVLVMASLSVFAWSIRHVNSGGKIFGPFTNIFLTFSSFPSTVKDVIREMTNPERLLAVDPDFQPVNKLTYDVFTVNSSFDNDHWVIELKNLRTDSTIHEWFLNKKDFVKNELIFSHSTPLMPLVLKDKSVVFSNNGSNNLFRLNSKSEILWEIHDPKYLFHHSLNLGFSEDIWACTKNYIREPNRNGGYWDDNLTRINLNTGEVIFHKSISQILVENDLSRLIWGPAFYHGDPIHLNDIEPVNSDGIYWKKGDLFLSLRNISTILIYRPSTNKVTRLIQGPFLLQHDVDVLSDSTISMFNNNISHLGGKVVGVSMFDSLTINRHSEVLTYNFRDSSFFSINPAPFEKNKILTRTQGLQHRLSNGDLFIESTDQGKVFIFRNDSVVYMNYANSINDRGLTEPPHWIRVYENLNFLK